MLRKEAATVGIVIILVILWFLGVLTKNTLGGLLHILLVIAVIFLLISVIRGRGL
jgi:DMSO reductase anchor subunit